MPTLYGMHPVDLQPGVKEPEFEQWVSSEMAPLYQQIPGQTVSLLKFDKGTAVSQYIILIEIESQQRRDEIYGQHPDGPLGEEAQRLVATPQAAAVFDKLQTFVVEFPSSRFMDYVHIPA